MVSVGEYLDLCKQRMGAKTDSDLARDVRITRAAIAAYRKGASFPSDENMLRLAEKAKLNVQECLLGLNIWRSEGAVQKSYQTALKRLYPKSDFL